MSISRQKLKGLIISGVLLTLIVPAMPALAEDPTQSTSVETTNNNSQEAASGVSGVGTTPPLEQPPVVDPQPVEETAPEQPASPAEQTTTSEESEEYPSSTPGGDEEDQTPADVDHSTSAVVNNNLDSQAQSGNASVEENVQGGNATSGTADAIATLVNLLQSTSSLGGPGLQTFIKDIYGDVFGDFIIDPRVMSNDAYVQKKPDEGLSINVDADARINNQLHLSAISGNANVSDNVVGGNATTGNANALLNLINIINSWAVAQQSFMGMINIHGNLNGDILLPETLLQQLLAHNAVNGANGDPISSLASASSMGIENNISQVAQSGVATVADNVSAGNAHTGDALTKLTLLNLTNRTIVGKDAIVVFVNVLGNWVGMIVNAPSGATAAALGSVSSGAEDTSALGGVDLTTTSTSKITNNILLEARTGDATVNDNKEAGDATTGNATTSVNLVNIINSQLSFSDWFGVLFINVFGNWHGSFGVDTAAGELPTPVADTPTTTPTVANLVSFVPKVVKPAPKVANYSTQIVEVTEQDAKTDQNMVLSFSDSGIIPPAAYADADKGTMLAALGGVACFFVLGAADKRRKHKADAAAIERMTSFSI